jgi:hypothetical protein
VDTADVGQIHAEPAGNIHLSYNNVADQFPGLLFVGLQIIHTPKFAKPKS